MDENKSHFLEAILNSSGDAIIGLDASSKVTSWNNTAAKLFNYTPMEASSLSLNNLIMENDKTKLILDNTSAGKEISHLQVILKRKNGTIFHGLVMATPIFGEDEKPAGTCLLIRDVTKEKEIDRIKTEFISLASHQLKTPLSAIKWYIEMLMNGDVGEMTLEQKEVLQNVNLSNERMIELVSGLLNVSRIESGRVIINPQPSDMYSLVQEVFSDLNSKFNEKHIVPVISIHPNLPQINIDKKLIRQVFLNLLSNALKYTPDHGEINIFVSKDNENVIVQISDSGYGIPAKDRDKVFSKFYRGENIIKVATEGNGLGLYLVKAIVESSNGRIWFNSVEGKGTTFWFSIPLTGSTRRDGTVSIEN